MEDPLPENTPRPLSGPPGTVPKGGLHLDVSLSLIGSCGLPENTCSHVSTGMKLGAGSLGLGMFASTFGYIPDHTDFVSYKADVFISIF